VVAIGGMFFYKNMNRETPYDTALKNVSEAHYFMKTKKTGNTEVEFSTGVREESYSRDGVSGKTVPFALVNITGNETELKTRAKADGTIDGYCTINGEQYELTFLPNPYTNPYNKKSYTCDIADDLKAAVNAGDEIIVTLYANTPAQTSVELETIMGDEAVSWERALKLATDACADKLKDGKYETYVTVENSRVGNVGGYYYVQFLTADKKVVDCIVAQDGSTIAGVKR